MSCGELAEWARSCACSSPGCRHPRRAIHSGALRGHRRMSSSTVVLVVTGLALAGCANGSSGQLSAVSGATTVAVSPSTTSAAPARSAPQTTWAQPKPPPFEVSRTMNASATPSDMALSPDGSHLYVTNPPLDLTNGSLFVMDAGSGVVVQDIPVGQGESRVAVSPDGSSIYVSTAQDDKVSVIDAHSGAVSQTIGLGLNDTTGNVSGVGLNPTGLATSPDGSILYVSEFAASRIALIDTRSHSVARNITVGEGPVGVTASADGSRVYVLNQLGINGIGSVSVIDATSSAVIQTINVGRGPSALAVSRDGAWVYVANNADLTISVIDARGGVVSRTVKLSDQPAGIAVAPDGSQIYATFTNTGATAILDAHDWTISQTVPVGSGPGAVVVSPDGSQLYVLNAGDGTGSTRVSVLARAG
jgi:YVTN family beta-propeller protein